MKERKNEKKKKKEGICVIEICGLENRVSGEGNGRVCNQQGRAEPVPERRLAHYK